MAIAYSLGSKLQSPGPLPMPIPTALRQGCSTYTRGNGRGATRLTVLGSLPAGRVPQHMLPTPADRSEHWGNVETLFSHDTCLPELFTMRSKAFKHSWIYMRHRNTMNRLCIWFLGIYSAASMMTQSSIG
jgi:hypothetical protein